MKSFFNISLFILLITSYSLKADYHKINPYKEFHNFYYNKKYSKALKIAENYLKKVDDNPNLGDLADLYIRLSEKLNKNPENFLIKIINSKKDYITKERIVLALGDYFFRSYNYSKALKYYSWLERNHNEKSLVYDDALWNSFLIFKNIKAYKQSLIYLNKIISTHEYSLYVANYNQFRFYDAYLEKYKTLLKLKKRKKAIKTLKEFIKNFTQNDLYDDALFELCKIDNKKYCCILTEKRKYSSLFNKAKRICNGNNN